MLKTEKSACVVQFIGFLPRLRKRNVRLASLAALFALAFCACAPSVRAAEFTSSSAREDTSGHVYFKDGEFGTDDRTGPAFETAPDGSRLFRTPEREKPVEPEFKFDFKVRPEINPQTPEARPPIVVQPR